LIHDAGKVARAALLLVVGSAPVSVACVVVPSGVYAMSHDIAGTVSPLFVMVAAADGLMAISTGTMSPVRVVLPCLSSVLPVPTLVTVPLALPPPSDWLYVVAVVPRTQ
jgi:hypothetical protein